MNRLSQLIVKRFYRKNLDLNLDRAIISFTFDDIPKSAITFGASILDRFKVPGTFYVSAGLLGRDGPSGKIATKNDIKSLSESGHQIGVHTFSHVSVNTISAKELAYDNELNKSELTALIGDKEDLSHFSYPFGGVSLFSKRSITPHFLTMRGIFPGVNCRKIDLSLLNSVALYSRLYHQVSINRWLSKAVRSKAWLIFYTHDVSEKPSPWGISIDHFESVVQKAISSGSKVLNVNQAYELMCQTTKT